MSHTEGAAQEGPIVKRLKELDDKYLDIQREFEVARCELAKRYNEKQQQFLERRKEMLSKVSDDSGACGTPALAGFWCRALKNHEAFEDKIKAYDEPVLEYLKDVVIERFDPETKGFKIVYHFAENPYLSNDSLFIEYHLAESNPYMDTVDVRSIKSSQVDWKEGQDVTIEKVAKKIKGGGAKKSKQKKEQTQRRDSFFDLFINISRSDATLEDVARHIKVPVEEILGGRRNMEEKALASILPQLLDSHYECGVALRDNIVPFAVRWYTGEACSDSDDDDDDEEDEEEESEEDSGDEDDSENEDAAAKPASKANAKRNDGSSKGASKGEGKEDCKQQ